MEAPQPFEIVVTARTCVHVCISVDLESPWKRETTLATGREEGKLTIGYPIKIPTNIIIIVAPKAVINTAGMQAIPTQSNTKHIEFIGRSRTNSFKFFRGG